MGVGNRDILYKVFVALFLKGSSAIFGVLLSYLIARVYGADGAGAFYIILSIVTILSVFSRFGVGGLLLKEIPTVKSVFDFGVDRLISSSLISVFLVSILLSLIMISLGDFVALYVLEEAYIQMYYFGVLSIIPYSLVFCVSFINQGFGRIFTATLMQNLTIYFSLCLSIFFLSDYIYISYLYFIFFVSALMTFVIGLYGLRGNIVSVSVGSISKVLRGSVGYLSIDLMVVLSNWLPILILGFYASQAESGIYSVASRVAWLLTFLLISLNGVIAPRFSRSFSRGAIRETWNMYVFFTVLVAFFTAPFAIALLLYPDFFLGFFGSEFTEGAKVLQVLVAGQLINSLTGPVQYLLMMTGYKKVVNYIFLVTSVFGLVVVAYLTKYYSGYGTALGATFMMVSGNLLMLGFAYFRFARLIKGESEN